MKREKIYKCIDTEREYQDGFWGKVDDPDYKSYDPAHFKNDIEVHMRKMSDAMYKADKEGVMAEFRKIAALCVKCGEVHGMPERLV